MTDTTTPISLLADLRNLATRGLADTLGIDVVELSATRVVATMPVDQRTRQPFGKPLALSVSGQGEQREIHERRGKRPLKPGAAAPIIPQPAERTCGRPLRRLHGALSEKLDARDGQRRDQHHAQGAHRHPPRSEAP